MVDSYINRIENHQGVQYRLSGKSLGDAWFDIGRFGLVALTLRGHEDKLFKRHLSFKSASTLFTAAPAMSDSYPLDSLAMLDLPKLKNLLSLQMTPLLESIFHLKFTEDIRHDELSVDKPYLQGVLSSFVNFPPFSFNEVHLEYHSKKKLVGGSIDIVVGSATNGNKPYVYLHTNEEVPSMVAIYLGSLLEVKSTDQRFSPASNDSAEMFEEDLKILKQAMLETMAIAEVATFPDEDVPILNILGNKLCYRPLLYFPKCDVLLTTPRVVHLRKDSTTINTQGFLLLFTLFHLHSTNMFLFNNLDYGHFPQSGWRAAMEEASDNYRNSVLKVAGVNCAFPHATSKHYLQPVGEDAEDGNRPSPVKKSRTSTSSSKESTSMH